MNEKNKTNTVRRPVTSTIRAVRSLPMSVKNGAKKLAKKAVARCRWRLGPADIRSSLAGLLDSSPDCLLMHSSLSRCGYLAGGPSAVIEVMAEHCGTLCLPTNAYCYPRRVDELGPIFDPRTSPSRVGQITESFRQLPGVVRSIHPTHSLAARGEHAEFLCQGHELTDTPCGYGTPYGKLIESDAAVLMFGATLDAYTFFHTAEDAANCPYLYFPTRCRLQATGRDGHVMELSMLRQNMRVPRRFRELDVELERTGLLQRQRLGRSELLFIPNSRRVHEFLLSRLSKDPYHLVDKTWLASQRDAANVDEASPQATK